LPKASTNFVRYVQLAFRLLGKAAFLVKRFSSNFLVEIFEFVEKFPLGKFGTKKNRPLTYIDDNAGFLTKYKKNGRGGGGRNSEHSVRHDS
jgi:hypothetical protein